MHIAKRMVQRINDGTDSSDLGHLSKTGGEASIVPLQNRASQGKRFADRLRLSMHNARWVLNDYAGVKSNLSLVRSK